MLKWKRVVNLNPGERLAENLKIGNLELKEETKLDRDMILKLRNSEIEWVCVYSVELDVYEIDLEPLLPHDFLDEMKESIDTIVNQVNTTGRFDPDFVKEMSRRFVETVLEQYEKDVFMNLVKMRNFDEYTFAHHINVATISLIISKELGLNEIKIEKVAISALIHDIGKLDVPPYILFARRKLTDEEFEVMKKHPINGEKICRKSGLKDEEIISGVLQHHEKLDGSGYPYSLRDGEITYVGRIVGVADVYDALTTERPYKKPWTPYEALSHIIRSTKVFDTKVVNALIRAFGIYPAGTKITLSNGKKAIVVGSRKGMVYLPIVSFIDDDGRKITVDLSESKKIKILKVGW